MKKMFQWTPQDFGNGGTLEYKLHALSGATPQSVLLVLLG